MDDADNTELIRVIRVKVLNLAKNKLSMVRSRFYPR
jgi:hypothetical protein